jgi:hypothetical protein
MSAGTFKHCSSHARTRRRSAKAASSVCAATARAPVSHCSAAVAVSTTGASQHMGNMGLVRRMWVNATKNLAGGGQKQALGQGQRLHSGLLR